MASVAALLAAGLTCTVLMVDPARAVAVCDAAVAVESSPVLSVYSADQLQNAATIMDVASRMGLGRKAQVLGVMTAMGESSLHNIAYGDGAINPDGTVADSVGLFQQQHWWGSFEERMDPATAAKRFYRVLKTVPEWSAMTPTLAAHTVQVNADPDHYTKFHVPARRLVKALAGTASGCAPEGVSDGDVAGEIERILADAGVFAEAPEPLPGTVATPDAAEEPAESDAFAGVGKSLSDTLEALGGLFVRPAPL